MEQEEKAFLNKFIAALSMLGVRTIPFAGEDFQHGISIVEAMLEHELDADDFNKVSNVFVKVPVDETYRKIRNMFMTLNGQGISFSGADNPLWTKMSIKMNRYLADKVLDDNSVLDIDRGFMNDVAEGFCDAAGVAVWEEF